MFIIWIVKYTKKIINNEASIIENMFRELSKIILAIFKVAAKNIET